MIARVTFTDRIGIASACDHDCSAGNFKFRNAGSARKILNCAAIKIARREVHAREITAGLQYLINQADRLEKLRPVHIRDQAHAGDDVAYGDIRRPLALMFVMHHLIGGGTLRHQLILQPSQSRGHSRILVTQALYDLHHKGLRKRPISLLAVN